jgi:ribosomal protein S18 acetylase RimI-like enzyme
VTAPVYSLRPATWADESFLYDLHRATMRAYVARTWGAWDESVQAAMFRAKFQPAMRQIVVVDGQAVGVVRVRRRPDALFLASIEVAPEQQGKGLGTAISRPWARAGLLPRRPTNRVARGLLLRLAPCGQR